MRDMTVLYDEGCGFCVSLADRLRRTEGVSVAPIGSERGERLLRDLSPAARYASVHVVDGTGSRRSGAGALPTLLRAMRGGRLPAWIVERFPRVAALGYRALARNRARVSRVARVARRLVTRPFVARRAGHQRT